jgi:hypothetical protein
MQVLHEYLVFLSASLIMHAFAMPSYHPCMWASHASRGVRSYSPHGADLTDVRQPADAHCIINETLMPMLQLHSSLTHHLAVELSTHRGFQKYMLSSVPMCTKTSTSFYSHRI